MIKIGYFGDGPWASLALSHIAKNTEKFSVAFITPRFDTQDPELKSWAEELNVPFLPHANVNDPAFIQKIKSFDCDLLISMSFNQILKQDILEIAPLGFINCHAGALPFYRGRNPLNWALINGEKEFGVTVHYVDEGIDTGDIIVQNMVPIESNDGYGDLLQKAHTACATTLLQALENIANDEVARKKQTDIHPVGFYCGRRREGDEEIDWSFTSEELHNFIRGITLPGPGARTGSKKGEVAFLQSRLITNAPKYIAKPGEVVGKNEQGILVKTVDTTLLITKCALVDKHGRLQEAIKPDWPIGARFKQTSKA